MTEKGKKDKMPEQDSKIAEYQQRFKAVVEARNFHYKSFLSWSTYFSVIVGALFVAYYSIGNGADVEVCGDVKLCGKITDATGGIDYKLLIAIIGFVVSLCWHWSNKGFSYWWYHWSMFLTDMEIRFGICNQEYNGEKSADKLDNKVYGVFYDSGSNFAIPWRASNISTSKVAMVLSYTIALAWCYLILDNCCICNSLAVGWRILITFIVTWLFSTFLGQCFQSNISNHSIRYITKKDAKEGDLKTKKRKKEESKFYGYVFSGDSISKILRTKKKWFYKKIRNKN